MKKLLLCLVPFFAACQSTPPQQNQVPLDLKTVAEYNQRVQSGNTVTPNSAEQDWELNASDRQPKVVSRPAPRIYPSVGIYSGWGHHRHHGAGIGLAFPGYYY